MKHFVLIGAIIAWMLTLLQVFLFTVMPSDSMVLWAVCTLITFGSAVVSTVSWVTVKDD